MKLLIKNKSISLSGKSTVTNEQGEVVYKVKGNIFSNIFKVHKKVIKDANGKKLFVVRDKFWHAPFHKSAVIFANGKKLAVVTTSHYIKNGFEVKGATQPIKVEGTGWNLDIILGEEKIGHIEPPEHLTFNDSYVLETFDDSDAPFLVAMVIAIDNIHDRKRRG